MPVASAAGAMPSIATTIRIKSGRSWTRAPSTMASFKGKPESRRCWVMCEIYSTPLITDIDGDGSLEVVVGSYDHNLYILDGEGVKLKFANY